MVFKGPSHKHVDYNLGKKIKKLLNKSNCKTLCRIVKKPIEDVQNLRSKEVIPMFRYVD